MRWRTIYTLAGGDLTGIAPVCPVMPMTHADHYVNECCPGPWIECYGEASAEALAVFLTALGAEPCS